jgi:hypothetical protein
MVVAYEFDPLRDGGIAIAKAWKNAGVSAKKELPERVSGKHFWVLPSGSEGQHFAMNLIGRELWGIDQMVKTLFILLYGQLVSYVLMLIL